MDCGVHSPAQQYSEARDPFQGFVQEVGARISSLTHQIDVERAQRLEAVSRLQSAMERLEKQSPSQHESLCASTKEQCLEFLKDYVVQASKAVASSQLQRLTAKSAEEAERVQNWVRAQERELHAIIIEASADTTRRLADLQQRQGELEKRISEEQLGLAEIISKEQSQAAQALAKVAELQTQMEHAADSVRGRLSSQQKYLADKLAEYESLQLHQPDPDHLQLSKSQVRKIV